MGSIGVDFMRINQPQHPQTPERWKIVWKCVITLLIRTSRVNTSKTLAVAEAYEYACRTKRCYLFLHVH